MIQAFTSCMKASTKRIYPLQSYLFIITLTKFRNLFHIILIKPSALNLTIYVYAIISMNEHISWIKSKEFQTRYIKSYKTVFNYVQLLGLATLEFILYCTKKIYSRLYYHYNSSPFDQSFFLCKR